MGASEADLRSIFFKNGLLIVATGWLSGLALGIGIIALQHFVGDRSLGFWLCAGILPRKSEMGTCSID